MKLRIIQQEDEQRITNFVVGILNDYGLKVDLDKGDSDLKSLCATYSKERGYFLIAECDQGELIGTFALLPLSQTTCELKRMYVASGFRGKGYGKSFLKCFLKSATERGFSRVELTTASVLQEAINLYSKAGFIPLDGKVKSSCCDRAYVLELSGVPSCDNCPT